jgi:hypothetical protein
VRRVLERGQTIAQVARDPDLNANLPPASAVIPCTQMDTQRPRDRWLFSQAERDYPYQALAKGALLPPMPTGTFVWRSTYAGEQSVIGFGHSLNASGGSKLPIMGHITAVTAGSFVFQVFSTSAGEPGRWRYEPDRESASVRAMDRASKGIWPILCRSVGWPPQGRAR